MELRPGYKLTEVGVIPEDWEAVPIGSLASFKSGNGISIADLSQESSDTPIPVYGGNGIAGYTSTALVQEPAVVIGRVGQKCGEVYLTEGPAWITDNALYPRVFFRTLDVPFLAFALKAAGLNEVKNHNDLPLVTQSILHLVSIPLPPTKVEQEYIAAALSDADDLIESLKQLIAKKRKIMQGTMQELLTGKKRLLGFRGEWEEKRLGELVLICKGELITERSITVGSVPVIAGGKKPAYFHNVANRLGKTITISGSGANAGFVAFFDAPIFASDCSTIQENNSCSLEFIYFQLSLIQEQIYKSQTGGAQPHIHPNDLHPIIIMVPSTKNEQIAIASILSDMDAEIEALEIKLVKACTVKQGMMQELLTGRIRLVRSASKVIPITAKKEPAQTEKKHNREINEAVIIGVLANRFGSESYPLGRKRRTKLTYLLHRHVEGNAEGFIKKAAGPYNPAIKYKGPEGIAIRNGYVRTHNNGKLEGFVAADKVAQAESYFEQWYGSDALKWLERFRYKKNDELELLATVDMAMEDLRREDKAVELGTVKQIIQGHPEWTAKLQREMFSDANITRAIQECRELIEA